MKEVKCECGHVNPHGTILCEACGKPTNGENSKKLLDMRYEGSARRSQTYNKTVIDHIWNFFSSVKVGIWLIVLTLIASAFGTIYPQEAYIPINADPSTYYEEQYGTLGALYYQLGFHNLYSSWWYLLLIASIGISLVICSLDRVIPLHRALKKQLVTRHESFLQRQRFFSVTENPLESDINKVEERLKKRGYRVKKEEGNLLGEKGRFSRWGPYVNHIGLIIFLIGAMLRVVPGMYIDKTMWLREGETKAIPGTNGEYFLENNQFIYEEYGKDSDEVFQKTIDRVGAVAKNYQTDVTLYKGQEGKIAGEDQKLVKQKDFPIKVNEPLKFDGYAVYQVDYRLNELSEMKLSLDDKQSGESFGTISIDLHNPKDTYELKQGYRVEILSYFPDFYFNEEGNPDTKTKTPSNPAFVFKMFTPDRQEGETSFVAIRQNVEPLGENKYKMTFAGIDTKNVTGLTVHKDSTLWILGLGGLIFMIGVIQGMYWNHRRIWVRHTAQGLFMASHTNKNWFGLKRELVKVIEGTAIVMPEDQQEKKKGGDKA
ncbi:cytochrome c biogenesis protein ResB [Priestia endophytica]|uniref:Cytochrome c biogenesis protein n=1 Tax=Priestia endophytica DSM 13796 TaxID=1121089 RepID=A0A1I5W0K5_9BACI|nr:cytochrome c biogenesis protein ResB [Priestia endophytica]KYG35929.1 cytochrome C biogenesis protein [Priestia endophytica]MBG9814873.1 cytochrome C biogenesis protein [Priestia endophytica]SFQ13284.1 cytochrome c biogenesis protein [Priestia endophytica DSM 13796]